MPSQSKSHPALTEKNLLQKTGKGLEQWMDLIKKKAPKGKKEQVNWLKVKFNLANGEANAIVKLIQQRLVANGDVELMRQHFKNGKEYQKAIYDKLVAATREFGSHYSIAVNKTSISFTHDKQFALLKPSKEGLVLGLPGTAVRATKVKGFVAAKTWGGARITHKMLLNDACEVDDAILKALKCSYDKS